MNPTYQCYTFCTTCHTHAKTEIPKGSQPEHVTCQNCENLTLKIDPNGSLWDRQKRNPDYI